MLRVLFAAATCHMFFIFIFPVVTFWKVIEYLSAACSMSWAGRGKERERVSLKPKMRA